MSRRHRHPLVILILACLLTQAAATTGLRACGPGCASECAFRQEQTRSEGVETREQVPGKATACCHIGSTRTAGVSSRAACACLLTPDGETMPVLSTRLLSLQGMGGAGAWAAVGVIAARTETPDPALVCSLALAHPPGPRWISTASAGRAPPVS